MAEPIYAYAITAPSTGADLEIVRSNETRISTTGVLTEVLGPFRIGGHDHYECTNMLGETLQIVHLQPGEELDLKTQQVFELLDDGSWFMPPVEDEGSDDIFPVGLIQRIVSVVWNQIKAHPFPAIGVVLMLIGAILYFFGYTQAGRYLIDVGMKFLLMLGATMAVRFIGFRD